MRQTISAEVRRALRSLALWFGVLALTIQGFAPLCLAATPGKAQANASGGYSIIICTAHGFERLTIGADGKPVPGSPSSGDASSACSLCAGPHSAGGFAPPVFVFAMVPRTAEAATTAVTSAPAASLPPHFSYVSRAPPVPAGTMQT